MQQQSDIAILLGGHGDTAETDPAQSHGHDVPPSGTDPACEPWPPLYIAEQACQHLLMYMCLLPMNTAIDVQYSIHCMQQIKHMMAVHCMFSTSNKLAVQPPPPTAQEGCRKAIECSLQCGAEAHVSHMQCTLWSWYHKHDILTWLRLARSAGHAAHPRQNVRQSGSQSRCRGHRATCLDRWQWCLMHCHEPGF